MNISLYDFLRKLKLILLKLNKNDLRIGKDVTIDHNVKVFNKKSKVILGDKVYLRGISQNYQAAMPFPTTLLLDVPNALIIIGENSRINGAYIHAQRRITIGKNCVIASGVNIIDTNGHQLYSSDRTKGRDCAEEISIGDNVWIGLNAIILKGTVIGDNSVVGAGSVVKGVFSKNSLIVGNPGKIAKKLDISKQ